MMRLLTLPRLVAMFALLMIATPAQADLHLVTSVDESASMPPDNSSLGDMSPVAITAPNGHVWLAWLRIGGSDHTNGRNTVYLEDVLPSGTPAGAPVSYLPDSSLEITAFTLTTDGSGPLILDALLATSTRGYEIDIVSGSSVARTPIYTAPAASAGGSSPSSVTAMVAPQHLVTDLAGNLDVVFEMLELGVNGNTGRPYHVTLSPTTGVVAEVPDNPFPGASAIATGRAAAFSDSLFANLIQGTAQSEFGDGLGMGTSDAIMGATQIAVAETQARNFLLVATGGGNAPGFQCATRAGAQNSNPGVSVSCTSQSFPFVPTDVAANTDLGGPIPDTAWIVGVEAPTPDAWIFSRNSSEPRLPLPPPASVPSGCQHPTVAPFDANNVLVAASCGASTAQSGSPGHIFVWVVQRDPIVPPDAGADVATLPISDASADAVLLPDAGVPSDGGSNGMSDGAQEAPPASGIRGGGCGCRVEARSSSAAPIMALAVVLGAMFALRRSRRAVVQNSTW